MYNVQILLGWVTQEFYRYDYILYRYYVTPVKTLYRTKSVPAMTALYLVIEGNTELL